MEADPEARAADAHALVDARHVRRAAPAWRRARRRARALRRRCRPPSAPAPITPTVLPRSASKSMSSIECAHEALVEPAKHRRRVRPAEPVAAVRQHDAARRDLAGAGARAQRQHDELAVAAEVDQLGLVLDRHVDHAPVPAQIVHPLQARDAVDLLPGGAAELRLEPGAERQVGKAERRPGQLRRRAQRLHARVGRPRALRSLRASGRRSAASGPRGI